MRQLRELVTSNMELVPTSNKLTSLEVRIRALAIAEGLTSIDPPNDMTAWYCKAFRALGESRYTAIAKMATVNGEPRKKLFGWLLREEMKRLGKA